MITRAEAIKLLEKHITPQTEGNIALAIKSIKEMPNNLMFTEQGILRFIANIDKEDSEWIEKN